MHRNARSLLRSAVAIGAIACGCGSNVQDLGRNDPEPADDGTRVSPGLEGNGALITPTRELSCPVSRPIEGAACGIENGSPCTFVGGPEASPDEDPIPTETTTTFCICTAEHRWSCLQGVTMKTLVAPLATGDACESGLVVERAGVTCRCLNGVARCDP